MNLSCTLEAIDILHKPDLLTKFRDLNIQLNFYHGFFDCDHELIKQQLALHNITPTSVHAPNINFSDPRFLDLIKQIKHHYNTSLITIHPAKADKEVELAALSTLESTLAELDVKLCLENFPSSPSQSRWVYSPIDIYTVCSNHPCLAITYDTSHTDQDADILTEFTSISSLVKILHLSNRIIDPSGKWNNHRPFRQGPLPLTQLLDRVLSSVHVVLEYLPQYQDAMIADYKHITRQ